MATPTRETALDLDGVRIVVTGANGFVGTRVCRRLASSGAGVDALVRREGTAPDLDGVHEVVGEFTQADVAASTLRGVDAVVHCAAVAGADMDAVRAVNRDGTATLTRAALDAGVRRFVHISTGSVYDRSGRDVIDEDTPRVPSSDDADPYSVTKAEAEREVEVAARDGLDAVILRPPAVLGAHPTSTWGERVPTMVRDGELPMRRGGGTTFAWVHVDDLADAVAAAIENDDASGGTFDVVAGCTTWRRYLEAVAGLVGAEVPDTSGEDGWTGRYGGARARAGLGWSPSRSWEDAMAELARRWSA